MVSANERAAAEQGREIAAELFRAGLTPSEGAAAWSGGIASAREQVEALLAASANLTDVPGGLGASGRHIEALRYLMAPPMSQDRFAIVCPAYNKSWEKTGATVPPEAAEAVSAAFGRWADAARVAQLLPGASPAGRAVALEVTAVLIAYRAGATAARGLSSAAQEEAVRRVLLENRWTEVPRRALQAPRDLGPGQFMQKVKMANAGGLQQEVDVACGLDSRGLVLALECKVSNDTTNSIKRTNDVLNKVRAWQTHWGNFVVTGAMLQGVFAPNDIQKLLDANVKVFWSHDIQGLVDWLATARAQR